MKFAAPALSVEGTFDLADGNRLFHNLSLTVAAGEWTCLLGPSGVGKSTLLRILAGLSTGGTFEGKMSASDGQPIQSRIAYMAQTDLIAPWLNVTDAVASVLVFAASDPIRRELMPSSSKSVSPSIDTNVAKNSPVGCGSELP